jgi:hypothetical protein
MNTIFYPLLMTLASVLFLSPSQNNEPAIDFLNSLDADQLEKTTFHFNSNSREFWSFLPGAMLPRVGISLSELTVNQKDLAFQLLASSLSESGYEKARQIISLESVLAEIDGNPEFRDPDKYHIAFYGDPSKEAVWGWSFEGHHLSLNFSYVNGQTAIAPRFLGASPATIMSGPRKGEKTLGKEADLALEIVNSLNEEMREIAIFRSEAYMDIVSGNAMAFSALQPVGLTYDQLEESQQNLLLGLINEYLSTLPEELAQSRFEEIQANGFDDIYFGWAGDTVSGKPYYYRIQGLSFLIEFDHTFGNANHIHTVWRDFTGDFGRDLLAEHYLNAGHH